MHSYQIIRALGALTVLFVTVTAFTPIPNIAGSALAVMPAIEPSDAIVVLAAGIAKDGELIDESMRRAVHGLELYKRGLASLIIFSGPRRRDSQVPSEANARSRLAEDMGVPPNAIVKIEMVDTTRQESEEIADFLLKRNARRILLVTESLHMRRARLVFERAGLQVFPAPSDTYSKAAYSPKERLWLAIRVIEQSMALVYYQVAGYI